LTRGLSIYLDLLRFVAALAVVVHHLRLTPGGGMGTSVFTTWGHEAVVVFFVLSEFVVHHAATARDETFLAFASSRISRIYSVIVPCIALTLLCDAVGLRVAPEVYQGIHIEDAQRDPLARIMMSLLLLNNTWVPIQMFSNLPYWSVCYEFWYYFLFAACFYFEGRQRWTLLAVFAFLAGPRALVEFPIWLMGAWAYRRSVDRTWSTWWTWLLFLQPIAVLAVYAHYDLGAWSFGVTTSLIDAKWLDSGCAYVLTDLWLGVSFALNLLAAKRLDSTFERILGRIGPLIQKGAARSFTLYLFHQPIMFLLAALMTRVGTGLWADWVVNIGTILLPLSVASVVEGQRYRLKPIVRAKLVYWVPILAVHGRSTVADKPVFAAAQQLSGSR
jgi:peptidoglycan/LPS O-acetylase OafA/YrhL